MKTKVATTIILLSILALFLTRSNERISNTLLGFVNPIKQDYKKITESLKEKSQSYIFQKESIEKLTRENRLLQKELLEQKHYISQIDDIHKVLPQLRKLPQHTVSITQTISYVKLNSFSRIILTKPKGLHPDRLYGLIQGKVVGGTAIVQNNQLYGYLTSDTQCRFSVFIGKEKTPGIALGKDNHEMIVKFIPKWHKINIGDEVVTSGLDGIFFANIPVGKVTSVDLQSSYKIAYIKTYNDIFHPKTFFLINNPNPTLAKKLNSRLEKLQPLHSTHLSIPTPSAENNITSVPNDINLTQYDASSIPSRIDQTKEEVIEPQVPKERTVISKPTKPKKSKKRKHFKKAKHRKVHKTTNKTKKPLGSTLDLF